MRSAIPSVIAGVLRSDFMHSAEIVERDMQRDRGQVTLQPLAKAVAEPREPL